VNMHISQQVNEFTEHHTKIFLLPNDYIHIHVDVDLTVLWQGDAKELAELMINNYRIACYMLGIACIPIIKGVLPESLQAVENGTSILEHFSHLVQTERIWLTYHITNIPTPAVYVLHFLFSLPDVSAWLCNKALLFLRKRMSANRSLLCVFLCLLSLLIPFVRLTVFHTMHLHLHFYRHCHFLYFVL
jgi:hypothetical protein